MMVIVLSLVHAGVGIFLFKRWRKRNKFGVRTNIFSCQYPLPTYFDPDSLGPIAPPVPDPRIGHGQCPQLKGRGVEGLSVLTACYRFHYQEAPSEAGK